MSKKVKKQTRKVAAAANNSVSNGSPLGLGNRPVETEFKPDYSQTMKDLRRIGVLAGSFFVVLIILSFFLR